MTHNEKTLVDVLRDFWKAKYYIFCFCGIALILAFLFLSTVTPYYKAEMIVSPAHNMRHLSSPKTEGTIQPPVNNLGNDAAFERFSNIYALPSLAIKLYAQEDVARFILQDNPFGFKNAEKKNDYFRRKVRIEPVSGTSFRRLYYYHPDPKFAARLLTVLHRMTDEHIRRSVLKETNERITYLNEAMSRSANPEHRRTLAALMMEQERVRMMVSLDQPFSASIVEPAYVSETPAWPNSYMIYPVFLFVGLLLGFVTYGLRHNA